MTRSAFARGFTLLEVLAAAVVVSLTLAGTYQLFARTLHQHANTRYRQVAMHLATSVAESCRAINAVQPDLERRCDDGDTSACELQARFVLTLQQHDRRAAQTLPDGTITANRGGDGRLRVTVSWKPASALYSEVYRKEVLP
ncbi:MAG: prepilin-type N-terminal cleavage/methylation domain-containing protein [Pseudomonadota bacterium]